MLKKIILVFSFILMITVVPAYAADKYGGYEIPVDIEVNGNFIKCEEKPFLVGGSTYIPLRAFAEAVGAQVSWDETSKTATVTKENHKFEFCYQNGYCAIDGVQKDFSIINRENLTFIPVRVVSETLGYSVEWDDYYFTVKITAPGVTVPQSACDYSYTYDDILYLGKITLLEAGSQSFEMKIGICNTIINRVRSGSFPNTVKEVIFDTKYGTQFPPAHTDKMNQTPSKEYILAAKCALNGVELVGNSLYFISTKAAPSSWAHKNRTYYTTIGNTNFYL